MRRFTDVEFKFFFHLFPFSAHLSCEWERGGIVDEFFAVVIACL
jgi:hypothetical protein